MLFIRLFIVLLFLGVGSFMAQANLNLQDVGIINQPLDHGNGLPHPIANHLVHAENSRLNILANISNSSKFADLYRTQTTSMVYSESAFRVLLEVSDNNVNVTDQMRANWKRVLKACRNFNTVLVRIYISEAAFRSAISNSKPLVEIQKHYDDTLAHIDLLLGALDRVTAQLALIADIQALRAQIVNLYNNRNN